MKHPIGPEITIIANTSHSTNLTYQHWNINLSEDETEREPERVAVDYKDRSYSITVSLEGEVFVEVWSKKNKALEKMLTQIRLN